MTPHVESADNSIFLHVLPKQRTFLEAQEDELLYSGAWGAGKSRALCMKALLLALIYPGTTIGLCRKTSTSLRSTTVETFFETCPRALIRHYHKSEGVVAIKTGAGKPDSRILFFGLVKSSGESYNIRSLNLGGCGVDETVEITETEWEELGGRLRDPRCGLNQLFGATNPASRGHWLFQRMFRNRVAGVHRVIETNALENPYLPEKYKERIGRMKGRHYERYVLGKWVDFEGLVYDPYDPAIHEITWEQFRERFGETSIPSEWRRVGGVDFGFHNPFVFQWWGISPDNEMFRYREIYQTRRTVRMHCGQINEFGDSRDLEAVYADHDAEDRATMVEEGIDTVPANKEKAPGIETVYNLLQIDPDTNRPRMFFIREALVETDVSLELAHKPTRTEDEFGGYRYPPGTERLNPKEEPIKLDDHGMDTTRYVAHTDVVGAGQGMGILQWVRRKSEEREREQKRRMQ